MKVSLNWVRFLNKKYGCAAEPAPDGIDSLVERIGLQLGAVEETVNLGERYKGIVVAKVISAEKHPNADKLKVCWIDDGGKVKKVNRGDKGLIHVVCGAPNVAAGQLVAWIPPGVAVPATFDKDPMVLEAREIRGQMSNGMIASAKELALGDDHTGILVVDQPAKPGTPFIDVYDLDDYVIDIENKMFTHRPDLFGLLGIAREIAGIQGHSFKSPAWYKEDADVPVSRARNDHKLTVKNEIPKLVPRFCALVIKDLQVKESPVWLKVRLSSVGIKPINNIVDVTNFFMHETGQPLHAYDYDKIKTGMLGVRLSKKGEQIKLLGDKTINIQEGSMVVTDGKKPVGLGGVMGGADAEVDENTKAIILEVGNWNQNAIRKSAMAHGLFTDAATRFTKNQSPRQNRAVIAVAASDILRLAGGRVCGDLIDDKHFSGKDIVVRTDAGFINSRLGSDLSVAEMKKLLQNVEFKVATNGGKLAVTVPFWRTDIAIPEDIVEEVGRLYGYDKLPQKLPRRGIAPAARDELLEFKSRVRDILSKAGANEVLTYSFVHGSIMKKAGQDQKQAYHIRNALSPDLQYYRQSLTPSLLEKVHPNIKTGYDEFALFEMGKGHVKGILDESKLPKEFERLSLVIAGKNPRPGAPYYAAKKVCDYLLHELGVHAMEYEALDQTDKDSAVPYYQPDRSATIKIDGKVIGRIGEYNDQVKSSLKLPQFCAGFELGLEPLMELSHNISYQPLNRFPELEQDLCLRSPADLTYRQLTDFVIKSLDTISKRLGYNFQVRPLDIYQKPGDQTHKQTTWRIISSHPDRTLTMEESNRLLDEVAGEAKTKLNAERI